MIQESVRMKGTLRAANINPDNANLHDQDKRRSNADPPAPKEIDITEESDMDEVN